MTVLLHRIRGADRKTNTVYRTDFRMVPEVRPEFFCPFSEDRMRGYTDGEGLFSGRHPAGAFR